MRTLTFHVTLQALIKSLIHNNSHPISASNNDITMKTRTGITGDGKEDEKATQARLAREAANKRIRDKKEASREADRMIVEKTAAAQQAAAKREEEKKARATARAEEGRKQKEDGIATAVAGIGKKTPLELPIGVMDGRFPAEEMQPPPP